MDKEKTGEVSSLLGVDGPVDSTNCLLCSEKDSEAGKDSVESSHGVLDLIEPFSPESVSEGIPSSLSTNENGQVDLYDNKSKVKVGVSSLRFSSSYTVN